MLRDSSLSYHSGEISVASNYEVDRIWNFIDTNISGFVPYFQSFKDSNKENRISDFLIYYFQCCMSEQLNGFSPYYFGKNPTQPQSDRETDVGVFAIIPNAKPVTLIEFEAKRLSKTANNKEYVCGERGGIERFKREKHAPHLSVCGMLGYVQSKDTKHWVNQINNWIHELSDRNTDISIHWSNEEILTKVIAFPKVGKYFSNHRRPSMNNNISLWHYFIEL